VARRTLRRGPDRLKNGNFTAYGQDVAAMKKALDTAQQAAARK
jgi:hypothetical protein